MWLLVQGAVSLAVVVIKFLSNIIVTIKKRKNADAKDPMLLNWLVLVIEKYFLKLEFINVY